MGNSLANPKHETRNTARSNGSSAPACFGLPAKPPEPGPAHPVTRPEADPATATPPTAAPGKRARTRHLEPGTGPNRNGFLNG